MTENQEIKILKEEKSWESDDRKIDAFIMAIQALEEIQQYRAIGTIEEFKALKEKIASKKVVAISLTHEGRVGNCPNCNNFVAENYDKNCPKCRRELDWQ